MSYSELIEHHKYCVQMMAETKQEPGLHAFWKVVYRWVCEQIKMTASGNAATESNPR